MEWSQISGWYKHERLYRDVVKLYDRGTLVVVGTYLGRCLCALGSYVRDSGKPFKVVGVDWCVGSGEELGRNPHAEAVQEGHGTFAGQLHRNVIDCGLSGVVTLVIADSVQAAGLFADSSLTMVFIDGRHDYESVRADIIAWKPKVRQGGVLAGDDMGLPGEVAPVWPGVRDAVIELLPGWKHVAHDGWVWENINR